MQPRTKSLIFVLVQFSAIAAILFSGPILAARPLLLLVEILGVALGLWALWAMRPRNFNITPDVRAEGFMVTRGPYAWIRHPMYTALLLVTGSLVADMLTAPRLLVFLVLAGDIVLKLRYEERLLADHYPAYSAYMKVSRRLIPLIY